jgi:hypothetical protein
MKSYLRYLERRKEKDAWSRTKSGRGIQRKVSDK